jgi:hypothetical protein
MAKGSAAETVPFLLQFPSKELRTELHKETLDLNAGVTDESNWTVSEYIVAILRKRQKVKIKAVPDLGENTAPFTLRFYDADLRNAIKKEARALKATMCEYIIAILQQRNQILN